MEQPNERALIDAVAALAAAEASYLESTAALAEAARCSGAERIRAIRAAQAVCDARAKIVQAAVIAYEAALQEWVDAGGDPRGCFCA